jgi:hypothetical protein
MTAKSVSYGFDVTPQVLKILRHIVKYTDDYFADAMDEPIIVSTFDREDEPTFLNCVNVEGLLDFLTSQGFIELDRDYSPPLLLVAQPAGRDKGIAVPHRRRLKVLQLESIRSLLNNLEGAEARAASPDRKVYYSRRSGTIEQNGISHHFRDGLYRKLLELLWARRAIRTSSGHIVLPHKPLERGKILFELSEKGISPERLKNMVDSFNRQMKRKRVLASIKTRGGIYLEVTEDS